MSAFKLSRSLYAEEVGAMGCGGGWEARTQQFEKAEGLHNSDSGRRFTRPRSSGVEGIDSSIILSGQFFFFF